MICVHTPVARQRIVPISSDVNADGTVNSTDLALVMDETDSTDNTRSDVDSDGSVSAGDALVVVNNLGGSSFTTSSREVLCPDGSLPGPEGCPCDPADLAAGLCEDPAEGGFGGPAAYAACIAAAAAAYESAKADADSDYDNCVLDCQADHNIANWTEP